MSNIIEEITSLVGSDVLSSLTSHLGESDSAVKSGLSGMASTILGGLLSKSSDQSAFGGIFDMLNNQDNSNVLDNLGSLVGGGNLAHNDPKDLAGDLMGKLFGSNVGGILDLVASASGLKKGSSSSLLGLVGPLVMGYLSKRIFKGGLNASGLISMLLGQKSNIAKGLPTGMGSMIGLADLSDAPAAAATSYSEDEGGSKLMPIIIGLAALAALFFGIKTCSNTEVVDAGKETVSGVSGQLSQGVGDALEKTKDAVTSTAETVGDTMTSAADSATDAVSSVVDGAGDMASSAADSVGDMTSAAVDGASDVATSAMDNAKDMASDAADSLDSMTSSATDSAGEMTTAVTDGASDMASDAADSMGDAVSSAADIAGNAASAVGDAASNVVAGIGGFFSRTLSSGVELNIPENGIENNLINFLEDGSQGASDSTWFNFDRLTFATGSSRLNMDDSNEQLDNIAKIMQAYPDVAIKIGGYTDNTGSIGRNMQLSQSRANRVMNTLTGMGVDGSRMTAEGFGPAHPVADNDTAEGRAQNRRIAIRVTSK